MTPAQRAERLLRCYPRDWRERYGEEFAELLESEIAERPHDPRRTLDVTWNGVLARLSLVGLRPGAIVSPRFALASVTTAIAVFAAAALSLWSQLRVARTAAAPTAASATGATALTVAGAVLAVLAVLAAAPIGLAVIRQLRTDRRLAISAFWIAVAITDLLIGARHFATQPALVGRGASLGRAATLSISTYWAHPSMLAAQSTPMLLWMIASPVCFVMLVVSLADVLRRTSLTCGVLRYEAVLARIAVLVMTPALAAAAWWVIGSQSAPGSPLQAGSLDVVLIAAMAATVVVMAKAGRRVVPA